MGYDVKTAAHARTPISTAELEHVLKLHELYRAARPGGQRANLTYRDLSGVDLSGRDLSAADLTGAFLIGAKLERANLTGTVLFASNLSKANLRQARLVRADLRGAMLRGADLTGADLFDADLRDGRITVWARSGELQEIAVNMFPAAAADAGEGEGRRGAPPSNHTDFSDAVLRNTKLVRANFRHAMLIGADLGGANLSGADLRGADLTGAVLTEAVLENAFTNGATLTDTLDENPAGFLVENLDKPLPQLVALHEKWVASNGRDGKQLDLGGFDLRTAPRLAGLALAALKAADAIFYGLDLTGIGLQAANLDRADLRAVKLAGADLRGISLKGARLINADLREVRLGPLVVNGEHAIASNLDHAELRNANLRGADLRQANFRRADLSGADLGGARLDGIELAEARLAGAVGLD